MQITVKPYSADNRDLWNGFVKSAKNGLFMFDREFMEYHADRFVDASLMFYGDDELIALLPASRCGDELVSHGGLTYGGFITGDKMKQHHMLDCFDALKSWRRENGIVSINYKTVPYIYHRLPAQEDLYALYRNNASVIKIEPSSVIDFSHPVKLPKGRKAQIARAKREGVIVSETTDFDTFIALENEVLAQRHDTKAVHTGAELTLLHSRFPENIKCVGAFLNGKLIAGTVLFIYDNVVHTQYLAADETAREIGALDLVIASCVEHYKESKRYFDFGISTEDLGRVLNTGLIAQKESFGARTIAYQAWKIDY